MNLEKFKFLLYNRVLSVREYNKICLPPLNCIKKDTCSPTRLSLIPTDVADTHCSRKLRMYVAIFFKRLLD